MAVWAVLPIILGAVSFIGCWTVYGIALYNNHVCSLTTWEYRNSCLTNETPSCCSWENIPTISTSGSNFPENSLFTATVNAGSFLFVIFCVCHHAHVLNKNGLYALLSKIALSLGCVAAAGSFMAGNCNVSELMMLHYFGATLSFVFVCLYMVILTFLTSRCLLTGHEHFLYPIRIIFTTIQISATILYGILFIQKDYIYKHISAVFEWILLVNVELYELSFAVEFYYLSSSMLSVLLTKNEEEKPLVLS